MKKKVKLNLKRTNLRSESQLELSRKLASSQKLNSSLITINSVRIARKKLGSATAYDDTPHLNTISSDMFFSPSVFFINSVPRYFFLPGSVNSIASRPIAPSIPLTRPLVLDTMRMSLAYKLSLCRGTALLERVICGSCYVLYSRAALLRKCLLPSRGEAASPLSLCNRPD